MSAATKFLSERLYRSTSEIARSNAVKDAYWSTNSSLVDNAHRYSPQQFTRIARLLDTAFFRTSSLSSINRIKRYIEQ